MSTQTITPERPGAVTKEGTIPEAPQSLIDEILAEQSQAENVGMVNLVHAARQAEQRIQSLMTLRAAALRMTSPIHWTVFKNPQGLVFVTPRNGAGELICQAYGIVPAPDGPPERSTEHGDRAQWIQTGSAYSRVLDLSATHLRAVCIEGQDFQGRPVKDVVPTDGRGKIRPGVGDTDMIQSTITQFRTKAAKVLSGIVTVSPAELASVWKDKPGKPQTEEDVIKQCHMGHGFSRDEREAADGGGVINERQIARLFGMASGRLKELNNKTVKSGDVVALCINRIMGANPTGETFKPEELTNGLYKRICAMIEKWEPPTNGEGAKAASGPSAPAAAENLATEGQKGMLRDKAAAKAKSLPKDSGIDSGAILHECIIEVCGAGKDIDDVSQDDLAAVVGKITAWGVAK